MSHELPIKVGDTVRLKSGGPLMTVNSIEPEHFEAQCKWFDSSNKCLMGMFRLEALEIDDGVPTIG